MAKVFSMAPNLQEPTLRWGKMFLLSIAVGILSGLAAVGMHYGLTYGAEYLIGRFTADVGSTRILNFRWEILLMPAIGGLISGLLVTYVGKSGANHGTNEFIDAFHHRGGNLPLRGPAIRAAASVAVISFGGSTGPEGPMTALGASIGSRVASLLKVSPQTRRALLIAGCAGGVGAIFQCPLGGALFAASVLYSDPHFEADSMVPAFVTSVISYSTFMLFPGFGHHLLEGAETLVFSKPIELLPYAVLGPLCGLTAMFFRNCFAVIEVFNKWLVRRTSFLRCLAAPWIAPACGGLLVGAMGCVLPQVMDGQYKFIQEALDLTKTRMLPPNFTWWGLAALFGLVTLMKCVATALTVGTGGSGGVFGPGVFIGGALVAFVAAMVEALFPGRFPPGLAPALIPVGMAGMISASMRTPIAAIVMITEITGSYGLIVPLMLVCVTAYVTGRHWGLNSAQVRTASESPAHAGDALVRLLETLRVRDVMETAWPYVVSPVSTLGAMVSAMRPGTRPVFAVVDGNELRGVVSVPDILRALDDPYMSDLVIASDLIASRVDPLHPGQGLYDVLPAFGRDPLEALPVTLEGGKIFVAMLSRHAIHQAVRERSVEMREHLHREHLGIAAIEQDEQLYNLLTGVSASGPDTIQRMPVPPELVGKAIRESDFRKRYAAQVIGIQDAQGHLQCPPDIDAPLQAEQLLLVILSSPVTPIQETSTTPSA